MGPFSQQIFTEIMAWINNYDHSFLWDTITHPRPNRYGIGEQYIQLIYSSISSTRSAQCLFRITVTT